MRRSVCPYNRRMTLAWWDTSWVCTPPIRIFAFKLSLFGSKRYAVVRPVMSPWWKIYDILSWPSKPLFYPIFHCSGYKLIEGLQHVTGTYPESKSWTWNVDKIYDWIVHRRAYHECVQLWKWEFDVKHFFIDRENSCFYVQAKLGLMNQILCCWLLCKVRL